MEKEIISGKQATNIMIGFIIGSSAVFGFDASAKNDVWISLIISIFISIPIVIMYSRILKLYPQKNLYEIVYEIFGKVGGAILSIIFIFYSFQLGTLVVRNFTEFIRTVSLDATPQLILSIFIVLFCLWILKSGLEVLGRLSIVFVILITIIVALTFIFLMKDMKFDNIKPILGNSMQPILTSAFSAFTFPFGETVLFMVVLSSVRKIDSPLKVYSTSVFIAGLLLVLALLRNIFILGFPTLDLLYFPSYSSVSKLNIGDFITRIEIVIATNFLFGGIIKISVCLYSTAKGVAKLFNINNYKDVLTPISLFMITFSGIIYNNIMQMFEFIKIYSYYAPIFQLILPVLIWVFAEIKAHKVKKLAKVQAKLEQ